jgi:hypothetical protein
MNINKIILLSPNEGMSLQHLDEFRLSSISASLFQKDQSLDFSRGDVIVIDMNKLKEEGKIKTTKKPSRTYIKPFSRLTRKTVVRVTRACNKFCVNESPGILAFIPPSTFHGIDFCNSL